MKAISLLSSLMLGTLFAATACVADVGTDDGEVATESLPAFNGIRVPGLVIGLQHNRLSYGPRNQMYSAFEWEAIHRRGGDLGAANHQGFEWWQLHDIGGDPAALQLPPGVVVALKHSANQASQAITSFGRNPVNGADFPGFQRMVGGDLGAPSGVGYFWYESTGAGFTNWSGVDAMLPKYTVVGLKHKYNQPNKTLVWNGVTYDAAASTAAPPGFRRVWGGDVRDNYIDGYYWFEKTTGEEIVTLPELKFRLFENLRLPESSDASVVDRDGDCLVDAMEASLAARFRPHLTFDSDESARLPNEPATVWRMYPTSASTVHIRYVFLFDWDGGYGPSSWCDDAHEGDNDAVDYDFSTTDGGMTWYLTKIDLSFKGLQWPANSRLEVFDKFHPKFYLSASKHHEYFNRDNDGNVSTYSDWWCDDDVNGGGVPFLVEEASFPGFGSNNVGEPGDHSDFVDFLPWPYDPHRIWGGANDCFVYVEGETCGTNESKFDGTDSLLPPPVALCSIPTSASGFVWGGGVLSGTVPASSSYSYNSGGSTNTITQTGTGYYRVDFPGLGLEYGGNVQVTSYGLGSERCKVDYWYPWNGTLHAYVACYSAAGEPANSLFTASYIRHVAPNPSLQGGYVWADQPWSDSYTPAPTYQWNSSGGTNTIQRGGTGTYFVTFPGVNISGGTVEVTAYGWGNAHCKVLGWGGDSVWVQCFSAAGEPVDSYFTLNFAEKSPHGTPSYAYVWAHEATSTVSYTPSTWYQKNFRSCAFAAPITIQRLSTGHYAVTIPSLSPTGSTVHVTSYAGSSEACKVVGWGSGSGGTQVSVACHDAAGQPADSVFVLVYSSLDAIIC